MGLRTIKGWCKMIRNTGSIQLSISPGVPCLARTNKKIQKVKHQLGHNKLVSVRSLAEQHNISKSSAHRILKEDFQLCACRMRVEPKLTNEHKNKQKLTNWAFNNFRKEDTMRILFSDEKLFDIGGI